MKTIALVAAGWLAVSVAAGAVTMDDYLVTL